MSFSYFFLHSIRLLILPWVSVSVSLCVLLACFPSLRFISTLPLPVFLCLFLFMSALFTFNRTLTSPVLLTLGTLSCLQPFPWEWANLMISFLTGHTHTYQTSTKGTGQLSLFACLPITTPHLKCCYLSSPTNCVPTSFNLRLSFYILLL